MSLLRTCRLVLSAVPALAINLYPEGAERFQNNFVMYIAFALAAARPWTWRRLVACGVLVNLLYGLATLIASENDPNYAYMATFVVMIPLVVGSIVLGSLDMYSGLKPGVLRRALFASIFAALLCLQFPAPILNQAPREVYSYVLAAFGSTFEIINPKLRPLPVIVCAIATAGHLATVGQILAHGPVQVPLEALLVSGLSAIGYVFLATSLTLNELAN